MILIYNIIFIQLYFTSDFEMKTFTIENKNFIHIFSVNIINNWFLYEFSIDCKSLHLVTFLKNHGDYS